MEIVKKLMVHMDKAEGTTYRDELLSKIVDICSQNNYQYITNFEWLVKFEWRIKTCSVLLYLTIQYIINYQRNRFKHFKWLLLSVHL